MAWNRSCRRAARACRPPVLEGLEDRLLLASSPALVPTPVAPIPAQAATLSPSSPITPADTLIGASAVRASYDVDGSGLAAAVIDTGVNYHHEAFGDGFGPGFPVTAGYDFGDNDPDPDATSWQHGTAVAGLLASHDPDHPGVAPGADVVALRVFGDDNQGDFDRIADALQWVVDHHAQSGITVVNLSISDGNNYIPPFLPYSTVINRITGLVQRLEDLDIPVVTATGNSFQGAQGAGFTAIIAETISVSGSDASDHFWSNAQRLGGALGGENATDLLAPAVGLTAPAEGNGFTTVEGTSFAAPQVSGAVLLLQQIYQERFGHLPRVADLVGWLKAGSDPIYDPVTKITIGRLDIAKAAARIPSAPARAPEPPAPAPATPPSTPAPAPVPSPPASKPVKPPAPGSQTPSPPTAPPVTPPASPPAGPPASPLDPPLVAPPEAPPTPPPDAPSAATHSEIPSVVAPPARGTNSVSDAPSAASSSADATELPPPPTPGRTTDVIGDGPASGFVPPAPTEDPTVQLQTLFSAALDALARERDRGPSGSALSNGQGAKGFTFAEGAGRVRVWSASKARTSLGPVRPTGTLGRTSGEPARARLQDIGLPQGPRRFGLARLFKGRTDNR
jgi:subtilisin family serine protease